MKHLASAPPTFERRLETARRKLAVGQSLTIAAQSSGIPRAELDLALWNSLGRRA